MAEHNKKGKEGEILAAEFLQKKGYEIVATNQKFGHAEIDIIAKIGNEVVFIEVKSRTTDFFGYPEEFIDAKKIDLMGKAAERFCEDLNEAPDIRFDLISVVFKNGDSEITHVEDAFLPGSNDF